LHKETVRDLSFQDMLTILAFPYILIGFAILCLLYAPIEWFKEKLELGNG